MKKADVKTGFACNNDCVFCVQAHKKKFGDKDTEELRRIIKEAGKDCDYITFTGGEPTIRKDILELVGFAKSCGFKIIQIQSNGRMFAYEKFCQEIIAAGANEFALAIHGHTEELHNYLTQADSFKQAVSGVRNLKRLKQTVIMNTVICKSNYRHLPEIAKFMIALGVDQFQFAFAHALGSAKDNFDAVVPRLSLMLPHLKGAINIAKKFNSRVMVEAVPPCLLEENLDVISEINMPDMAIFDLDHVVDDFKKSRMIEGKLKDKRCKTCRYYDSCEGLWREYPEAFGWDEIKPIQ